MKSSDNQRYAYGKAQLVEVICQLRFPTILSIETKEPADFQEMIRAAFPRYLCQVEQLPAVNGVQQTVKNRSFLSEDGSYKLSLTKGFIALSTMRYTNWEDFARALDEPLGQFIRLYRPACFDRVGLRYVNAVSREALGLAERRWNDLFQPPYLGILDEDGVAEESVTKCSVDVERRLDEHANLKLHAGPGLVQRNVRVGNEIRQVQEKNVRFIFDQDVFSSGKVKIAAVAETLDALHSHADSIFSDAITTVLHDAMEPELL